MKYITGAPRNEETEVDSEATFTALGWFSKHHSDWLIRVSQSKLANQNW